MKLVTIESPYSGLVERNLGYLHDCVHDSLKRGEAPFASHGFYTRFLDDEVLAERDLGICCNFAWMRKADLVAFYVDYGVTDGMRAAFRVVTEKNYKYEIRRIKR